MAIKQVSLSYVSDEIVVYQYSETLDKGDQLEFVATDGNLYTVIIEKADIYFNTSKKVLMYDVSKYQDSISLTPTTKPNVQSPPNGLGYTVIVTTVDKADRTNADAPPKIIILPHS